MPAAAPPPAKKKTAAKAPKAAPRAASAPRVARPARSTDAVARRRTRRRQARLFFGTALFLAGGYICASIVAYFFTWKADQDLFIGPGSLRDFVLRGRDAVANPCGRLGAALGHLMVYRGAGVAAGAVGIWIAALGWKLLYGQRRLPVMRYARWTALTLLVAAPALAYLLPTAEAPWGGALGTEAVAYGNGLVGPLGTGAIILGAALFVVFGVFALDISPMIGRWRRRVRAARDARNEARAAAAERRAANKTFAIPVAEDDEELEEGPATIIAPKSAAVSPSLEDDDADDEAPVEALTHIPDDEASAGKSYDLTLSQKEAAKPAGPAVPATPEAAPLAVFPPVVEETLDIATAPAPTVRVAADAQPSFEVVAQHEEVPVAAAVKHGAHISVESGEPYAPELDLPDYRFPTLDLLEERSTERVALDREELEANKAQIIQTLRSFSIEIQSIKATVGPTVTLYEIVPAEGVRISKIRNLEDDIALALSALGIRIIAPIPGKGTIGIEVPNAAKQIVSMQALLASEKFAHSKMSLPIALGKTISNENYIVDLATMPHLLMAGATGQGKSVGINAILVSLLYKKHPSQLKFVLVDPKKVELSIYRTIEKHFLAKLPNEEEAIITDTKKVIYTLNALCIEMDNRYELLKEAGARNIKEYNDKFIGRRLNPERGHKFLPFIVLVVDEFADLIMTAGKEVEMPIARLAQLARAVGIHLIIATQRPSVNVITGTIKANFPGRVAFKVSAKVDSRTILDAGGAEQLVGRGDMLVSHGSELLRVQCAFVDTPEVEKVADFIGSQRGYPTAFELPEYEGEDGDSEKAVVDLQNRDKLFDDCARVVVSTQSGSTSMLQRRFNLGYNRAGRIMDQLEAAGIVGPAMGSKPREVYFHTDAELEEFLQSMG